MLHKISEGKKRNAHIYFRGGELTHCLQDKAELLTTVSGTVEERLSNAASGAVRTPIRSTTEALHAARCPTQMYFHCISADDRLTSALYRTKMHLTSYHPKRR